MSSSARVTSIDALRHLKAASEVFDSDARNAIAAITLEVRRLLEWIEHDRTRYWPRELRKAFDRVTEARNDLERCQMRSGDDNARSCYDEKKALERAKRRVRTCEEKIQQVRHWRRQLRHDAEEFTGQLARLEGHLDIDWAKATAALERMIAALDRYSERRESSPASGSSPVSAGSSPTSASPAPGTPPLAPEGQPLAPAGPPAAPAGGSEGAREDANAAGGHDSEAVPEQAETNSAGGDPP